MIYVYFKYFFSVDSVAGSFEVLLLTSILWFDLFFVMSTSKEKIILL